MAKKKKAKAEEDDSDVDDLGDFEDGEIEIAIPKTEKKPPIEDKIEDLDSTDIMGEEGLIEEEFELELEEEKPTYRFLDLKLTKGVNENDYELAVEGQSHGFCNIFVKHLLNIEGVNIAAYKVTRIEDPKIFIRLEKGYKIKEILHKGIENLREEVLDVQKLFQKLV